MGNQFNEWGACQATVLSHSSLAACDGFCIIENIIAFSKVTKAIRQGFWLHSWLMIRPVGQMLKTKQSKTKNFMFMEILPVLINPRCEKTLKLILNDFNCCLFF